MSNYARYKDLGDEYKSSDINSEDVASNPMPNKRANQYFTYKDLDDVDNFTISQTTVLPDVSDATMKSLRKTDLKR